MAGLILCRSRYAKRPYYISNMAINIYSLEELCYYIYNNIYLIGTDLFDEGLISFIRNELSEPELSSQLEFLTEENAGLSELVITVLQYVDYYSPEEIANIRNIIDELDTQNPLERIKARADNFLSNKRYSSAIRNYDSVVNAKKDMELPDVFYGGVWHNMGVSYARMYDFYQAKRCFERAYVLNRSEESKKAALYAECLNNNGKYNDSEDEEEYIACREIETVMDHATMEPSYDKVKELSDLHEEGNITGYYDKVDRLIEKWKNDYRNYVR